MKRDLEVNSRILLVALQFDIGPRVGHLHFEQLRKSDFLQKLFEICSVVYVSRLELPFANEIVRNFVWNAGKLKMSHMVLLSLVDGHAVSCESRRIVDTLCGLNG